MIRLALFQPDIPQNVGAILRLAACLNVPAEIIEPCGFPLSEKSLRRTGMDYLDHVDLTLHAGWTDFCRSMETQQARLVLLTTKADQLYTDCAFASDDVLLVGRESAGVPSYVHQRADCRIAVPLAPPSRSLNVAVAAAMVLGEALRQTGSFPQPA